MPRPSSRRAVWWTVLLLPLLFQATLIPFYGRLQVDDYYGALLRLSDGDTLSDEPHVWYNVRIGPHRILLPALLWKLNISLARGSNRTLGALCLTLLAAIFVLLERSLPFEIRSRSPERWLFGLFLSIAVFAPAVAYNVGRAFAGTHYFLADLWVILAVTVLVRIGSSTWAMAGILGLGLLAAFTFTSGLALWPALLVGAWHLRIGRRRVLFLVAAAVLCVALYAYPVGGSTMVDPHLGSLLRYVFVFLGSAWSGDRETAMVLGGCGLLASSWIQLWKVWRRVPDPSLAPWIMVQTYCVTNAVLAGLGRSVRGIDQALAVRYTSFSTLFWASLFVAAGVLLLRVAATRRAWVLTGLALVVGGATISLAQRGLRIAMTQVSRGDLQRVAELAVAGGYWDRDLIRSAMSSNPPAVIKVLPLLKNLRHVPFDRAAVEPSRGRTIPRELLNEKRHPEVRGCFCRAWTTVAPTVFRVRGFVEAGVAPVEDLVIVDDLGRERSLVVRGLLRRGHDRATVAPTGWDGFALGWPGVEPGEALSRLRAYVRLRGDPRWYPLPKRIRQHLEGSRKDSLADSST